MKSYFTVFFPDFRSASQHKEKAEASSNAENRFDRVSNGIVDALKDSEDLLEMGGVGKIVFTPQTRNGVWSCYIAIVFRLRLRYALIMNVIIFRLWPRWLLIIFLFFPLIHLLLSSLQ
ncbi:hypothetical protein V6N13_113607 [Hibiscus sabdariffa]|uniref:Uncharacterized protein n=1 Tax=Hibiscus sabdariffa TaxID=183260 RepID=A0ABR2TZN4_9ROSI